MNKLFSMQNKHNTRYCSVNLFIKHNSLTINTAQFDLTPAMVNGQTESA